MSVSKYKPEYCKMLIDHMSMGLSFESFGAVVSCATSTIYDWVNQHPDFKEAKEVAKLRALLFFEQRLSAKISGSMKLKKQDIDPSMIDGRALQFALSTRFHEQYGKREQVDHNHNITGPVFVDEEDD